MNWSSWSEFFSMGGYGVYVWGSYFVTFACVIGEVLLVSRRKRTLIKRDGLTHKSNKETYSVRDEELNN
ncbi:heme exporter protein D [Nitrosomonas sp. Nm51]|uniref:heme exporter protein CcmD n=1 Tax=Nitrosomonas sp. Nm51 TaxID=133720 RepID=UPI0008D849E9|nr:heme exporter protein CcmD [Nitrosomonas sp. Nm51]SEQ75913.1 heme exporter protein D [Nitrosomonas sp. Nm51]